MWWFQETTRPGGGRRGGDAGGGAAGAAPEEGGTGGAPVSPAGLAQAPHGAAGGAHEDAEGSSRKQAIVTQWLYNKTRRGGDVDGGGLFEKLLALNIYIFNFYNVESSLSGLFVICFCLIMKNF